METGSEVQGHPWLNETLSIKRRKTRGEKEEEEEVHTGENKLSCPGIYKILRKSPETPSLVPGKQSGEMIFEEGTCLRLNQHQLRPGQGRTGSR